MSWGPYGTVGALLLEQHPMANWRTVAIPEHADFHYMMVGHWRYMKAKRASDGIDLHWHFADLELVATLGVVPHFSADVQ